MNERGVLSYLGHPPCPKERANGIDFVPTLVELASTDWAQNNRPWPFAHLAEALSGLYSAKPHGLVREGTLNSILEKTRSCEVEQDKVRKGETNVRRFSAVKSPDSRETSEENRLLQQRSGPLQCEQLGRGSRNSENQGLDSHLRDQKILLQGMGKSAYTISDESDDRGDADMNKIGWFSLMAGAEQSMQIRLGKSVLSHGIRRASSASLEKVQQNAERLEESEDTWEYGFSREPLPDLLSRKPRSTDCSLKFEPSSCLPLALGAAGSSASSGSSKLTLRKIHFKSSQKPTTLFGAMATRTEEDENDEVPKLRKRKVESAKKGPMQRARIVKQLLCGGFAGVISRTAVAPLDLIKAHLITSHGLRGAQKSALTIGKEIVEQSGWQGLFRGNLVNCLRVAPNKAIELCVFEMVRRALNKEGHPLKNLAATIAGGAAGMAGTIATYPLELIRTRLSVQPELYSGLMQAVSKIVREEGFIAFYSGLSPSLVGVFPYAATNYFVYDCLRTTYCRSTGRQNVPTVPTLAFGAVAAAASSTVTYPLEVARRQMQLCLMDAVARKSSIGVILDIYKHEGFFALYRGLGTTWLKLIPAAGISFMCYEAARLALHIDDASILKPEEVEVSNLAEQELNS